MRYPFIPRQLDYGRTPALLVLCIASIPFAATQLAAQDRDPLVGTAPGQEWADNVLQMKFRWCPPGKFVMGSPADEAGREDDEDQVTVTISAGFWMGQYEVTQEQWKRVMNSTPSESTGDQLPVERISWDEATRFCQKLTIIDRGRSLPKGWTYRLPTEAQWEYACRAGTTTAYYYGNDPSQLGDYAVYSANSQSTSPAGQKKANSWGLHDMHGYVYEWCRDWWHPELLGDTDPEATRAGMLRVLRSGGMGSSARFCRSANRGRKAPTSRAGDLGFRVALVRQARKSPAPE